MDRRVPVGFKCVLLCSWWSFSPPVSPPVSMRSCRPVSLLFSRQLEYVGHTRQALGPASTFPSQAVGLFAASAAPCDSPPRRAARFQTSSRLFLPLGDSIRPSPRAPPARFTAVRSICCRVGGRRNAPFFCLPTCSLHSSGRSTCSSPQTAL